MSFFYEFNFAVFSVTSKSPSHITMAPEWILESGWREEEGVRRSRNNDDADAGQTKRENKSLPGRVSS